MCVCEFRVQGLGFRGGVWGPFTGVTGGSEEFVVFCSGL